MIVDTAPTALAAGGDGLLGRALPIEATERVAQREAHLERPVDAARPITSTRRSV